MGYYGIISLAKALLSRSSLSDAFLLIQTVERYNAVKPVTTLKLRRWWEIIERPHKKGLICRSGIMVLRWAPNPKIEVRFLAPMPSGYSIMAIIAAFQAEDRSSNLRTRSI